MKIKITQTPVEQYFLKAYCECGGELNGPIVYNGQHDTQYNNGVTTYGHQCYSCKKEFDLESKFPRVATVTNGNAEVEHTKINVNAKEESGTSKFMRSLAD